MPTLTKIAPTSVDAGEPGVTLTLTGTGFTTSSSATWQLGKTTASLTTTYLSPTSLTAAVPASLITKSGPAKITVSNPAPGGGTSNAKSFSITTTSIGLSLVSASRDTSGNIDITIALSNTGLNSAPAVTIKKTTLGSVLTTTALPVSVGAIAAGGSADTTLVFPGTIGKKGQEKQLAVSGGYTGGSFSDTLSTTLP